MNANLRTKVYNANNLLTATSKRIRQIEPESPLWARDVDELRKLISIQQQIINIAVKGLESISPSYDPEDAPKQADKIVKKMVKRLYKYDSTTQTDILFTQEDVNKAKEAIIEARKILYDTVKNVTNSEPTNSNLQARHMRDDLAEFLAKSALNAIGKIS